ncbi:hypothetical protein L915_10773 [Phytophthora nicotianae]|uniref:FYVE-type domain-containing protein n=1 Tax=Phytophthora nicotianae TaxID=4792 RepID=W2GMZ8_PHYNI|nr:hypothetical protein L915_10773 [Phytophthora nicotianae]
MREPFKVFLSRVHCIRRHVRFVRFVSLSPAMVSRNIRLHLDKPRESSVSSSSSTDSVASSWSDGEPPAPPFPLAIALRDVMADAEALHDRVDFATYIDIAESPRLPLCRDGREQWKRLERSSTFTLLKREDEVLALARLDASVEEVAKILGGTTDPMHAAAMKALYGDSFIAGSVAYIQRPRPYEEDQVYQQLAVKSSNFVHSDMLGNNEQWCFAEILRCKSDGDSFTLTQGSLSSQQAHSLPARSALKDSSRRVAQLRDVTAAYLVERMPGSHGLRVVFHAIHRPNATTEHENEDRVLTRRVVRARLLRLGRGISQLSQLARRRRFGMQVYADRSAFDERNPRCICCTRKFTILFPRTRCYLCGYYICVTCSSSEKMETHNGRLVSIIVCSRCRNSVTACDYEHMMTVIPGPERVLPDSQSCLLSPTSSTTSDSSSYSFASSDSSSSLMLADLLDQVADDDEDSGRRQAAFTVLNQLIAADQTETQNQVDKNATLLRKASTSPRSLMMAKQAMDVSECPADLDACKFASAESRPYPMIAAVIKNEEEEESKEEDPVNYPIPSNEESRMASIEHFRLHDVINVPELNVICTLAAAEMNCPHSVLTLVERDVVTLMATNDPENWDLGSGNPREQTFCQHFVMDDKPLLVRHAEADMRFYHIAPVTMRSLRFYAGFPVSVPCASNTPGQPKRVVVGALCCLDAKPHQMTRSQYWRLMKLADAASSILERTATEYVTDPKNHPLGRVGVQPTATTNGIAALAC